MTTAHVRGCACEFCRMLAGRTQAEGDWRATHAPHVQAGATYGRAPFRHPSEQWYWLVCACGARYLKIEDAP